MIAAWYLILLMENKTIQKVPMKTIESCTYAGDKWLQLYNAECIGFHCKQYLCVQTGYI